MKNLFILIGIIFLIGCCNSCDENRKEATAEQRQAKQTNQILSEIDRQLGLPNMSNFQQKKLMKMVYELCDKEDLICYAYIKSDYHGKLFYIGKCIGFGVPFSAQYTNPEKVVHKETYQGGSYGTLPQADPNGLYMPTSSSATWLMMIDPKDNKPRPVYLEPEIVVSPFPLH
jgi:hypothetical protein